jgi:hypothetical protein
MQPSRHLARWLIAGALIYAGLSAAVLVDASWLGYFAARLPRWVGLLSLTVIGPALFLAHGIETWRWYVGSLFAFAACLVASRIAWRQWPDSRVFVFGLLAAGVIWAASGWLSILFAV